MRFFLPLLFVALAVAACADLKTAEPAGPAPTTETQPTNPAAAAPGHQPVGGGRDIIDPSGAPNGSDNASPNGDSGTPAPPSVDDVCEPYCGWRDRCPGTDGRTHAECVEHCHGQWAARVAHLDRRYITYVKACFPQLACGKTDDTCFSNYAVVDPDPVNVPEVKQCLALVTTCAGVDDAPTKSDCYVLTALDQATRTAAAQCFALECSVMSKCMGNTWGGE